VPSIGDLGEDALVAGVIAAFGARTSPAWLSVGPGDDAAVLDLAALAAGGSLVTSTDTLVEGQDFRLDWSSGADVGVKVAAQNFADLAAMGASPAALLVSLAIPGSADADWAFDLARGLGLECARAGAVVAGGDVSAAREIVITGTAFGMLPAGQAAVLRSGARPGDVVAIAGQTGRSGAGLALLRCGHRSSGAGRAGAGRTSSTVVDLITSHQRPQPPYPSGPLL
jgi:thiamine-monophosphate kinase